MRVRIASGIRLRRQGILGGRAGVWYKRCLGVAHPGTVYGKKDIQCSSIIADCSFKLPSLDVDTAVKGSASPQHISEPLAYLHSIIWFP